MPDSSHPTIGILGPGGVGGFLGNLLSRFGSEIVCVGSPSTVDRISQKGIPLRSAVFGDGHSWPKSMTQLNHPVDFLLVTVKSPFLLDSLKRIPPTFVKDALVVTFLNGIEHPEVCRKVLGAKLAAASISVEALVNAQGEVEHRSPHSRIEISSADTPEKVKTFVSLLKTAGLDTEIRPTESDALWRKLARLNALACTTAASQQPIGFVRSHEEWRKKLINSLQEGLAVARKDNVQIDFDATMSFIDGLPEKLSTSLQRDVAKGVPNELDAIAGAVVRRGELRGVPCPEITGLIKDIRALNLSSKI